MIQQFECVVRA